MKILSARLLCATLPAIYTIKLAIIAVPDLSGRPVEAMFALLFSFITVGILYVKGL